MKITSNVKLGIVAGLINSIAWYAFAKKLGFYTREVYLYNNYVAFFLLISGVFLSIYLKKRSDNGILEFKDALKTGLLYSLVFAIVLAVFNYIYYTIITPDTIDYFLSEAKTHMENDTRIKKEDIPKYLESVRTEYSSLRLFPRFLMFGLISSLLAGLILQKKGPTAFSAN